METRKKERKLILRLTGEEHESLEPLYDDKRRFLRRLKELVGNEVFCALRGKEWHLHIIPGGGWLKNEDRITIEEAEVYDAQSEEG